MSKEEAVGATLCSNSPLVFEMADHQHLYRALSPLDPLCVIGLCLQSLWFCVEPLQMLPGPKRPHATHTHTHTHTQTEKRTETGDTL